MRKRRVNSITLAQGRQLMFCESYSWVRNYAIIYYYFIDHFGKLVTKNVDAAATIKGEFVGSKVRAYNALWREIQELELSKLRGFR